MTTFYVPHADETPPPVPDGPLLCTASHDMRMLHNGFLWCYERAGGLVRGVAAGDTARSTYVGQWLGDLDATLHSHHDTEDTYLWDRLAQRAPACALHVGQMKAHHEQVQALLHEAGPLLASWSVSADPATGEQLADAYERMLAVLKVHLRREVVEVMPVADRVITAAELKELGDHSIGSVPKRRLMPQLGMFLQGSEPPERQQFFAAAPAPIRLLFLVVGRRQFVTQWRTLFPGEPVPETVPKRGTRSAFATSRTHRVTDRSVPQYWNLGTVGALAGVAWAAAFRAYMWQISENPQVDWVGTLAGILLPGGACGALLGVAEARRWAGLIRGLRWFGLAPLAFAAAALALPGALRTFLTTGIGGGAVGVALLAIAGGFALGHTGPRWTRILVGALAAALLGGVVATVPFIGGEALALTTPRGAWVAVLAASHLAVLAVACSIPFRGAGG